MGTGSGGGDGGTYTGSKECSRMKVEEGKEAQTANGEGVNNKEDKKRRETEERGEESNEYKPMEAEGKYK